MIDELKNIVQSFIPAGKRKIAYACILPIFRKLNVVATDEEENQDYYTCQFEYQGGHFTLYASKKNADVMVRYPWFYEENEKYRSLISMIVNNLNVDYLDFVFMHTYYVEENKVGVHLKTQFELYDTSDRSVELFKNRMSRSFMMQRAFVDEFLKQKENYDKNSGTNIYEELDKNRRENYLVLEHEAVDHNQRILHRDVNAPFTLASLLDYIPYREETSNIISMKFVTPENVCSFQEEEAIRQFNLKEYLRKKDSDEYEPYAQILLRYGNSNVTIDFNRESQVTGKAVYYSVTLFDAWQFRKESKEVPKPTHCILAFDHVSSEEMKAEVKFMRDDAQDKIQEGNLSKLTDAQRLMKEFADWEVADDIYWGERDFLDMRYVEAISHFESALSALNPVFLKLDRRRQNAVCDIYYRTGFCYVALQNYPKAIYYLGVAFESGSIKASIEYINCLISARDVRALSTVNRQLESVVRAMDEASDDEEDSSDVDAWMPYYKFLLRRKSYLLIDCGDYDRAESVLKDILKLEDQEMTDYALREMEYIRNQRKQQQEEQKNKK